MLILILKTLAYILFYAGITYVGYYFGKLAGKRDSYSIGFLDGQNYSDAKFRQQVKRDYKVPYNGVKKK